jgi:hypothetical protein
MIRSLFIASAAAALAVIRLPLAMANMATGWTKPTSLCPSAVVWLDIPTGIYYRRGERRYGRTDRGAYTCEYLAISAGNRANIV